MTENQNPTRRLYQRRALCEFILARTRFRAKAGQPFNASTTTHFVSLVFGNSLELGDWDLELAHGGLWATPVNHGQAPSSAVNRRQPWSTDFMKKKNSLKLCERRTPFHPLSSTIHLRFRPAAVSSVPFSRQHTCRAEVKRRRALRTTPPATLMMPNYAQSSGAKRKQAIPRKKITSLYPLRILNLYGKSAKKRS